MKLFCCICVLLSFIGSLQAWGSSGQKVKLTDVKTLTLHHGQMTTGRRSKPVPQIQCVGGTAGCSAFVPQVVQCYNRGSDGFDVQWECKTDMDNAFRFGRVDVVCEGYDYADDPYILKGSCGLEYTIDLTEEGIKRKGQGQHNYYGSSNEYSSSYYANPSYKKTDSQFGNALLLVIIVLIFYAVWKTCARNMQRSPTDDDYSDPSSGFRSGPRPGFGPPPPGFRADYGYGSDASCGASGMGAAPGPAGGGFWSGAMTGGLLGYMFGNRNRDYTRYEPYGNRSWGGGSWGGSSGGGGFSSGSTGTRTASGFGGTRRR